MKKLLVGLAVLVALVCGAGSAFSAEYVEGEVLVTIGVPQSAMSTAEPDMAVFANSLSLQADSFAKSIEATTVRTYAEIAKSTGNNIIHLKSFSKTTEELVAELKKNPEVKRVTPNYIHSLNVPSSAQKLVFKEAPQVMPNSIQKLGVKEAPQATPNDEFYGLLYGMQKISANRAWDKQTGTKNVVVAVLDTGIDYNHEDLAANMVKDSNGKYGWSAFVGEPMDGNGHGTHCSGTIGAKGNNTIGVVGVNWDVGLLAVKVLGDNGSGSSAGIMGGLNYVAAQNRSGPLAGKIKVASMSLGGWWPKGSESNSDYHDAFNTLAQTGVMVVIAAGNESQNIDNPTGVDSNGVPYAGRVPMPASVRLPNTITVGSTTDTDAKSDFSNYSPNWVDIAAPGSDIGSTTPGNGYQYKSGTSMATPHVAGAVALLFAAHSNESFGQIRARIVNNSDANNPNFWKNGRLNVDAAIGAGGGNDPVNNVALDRTTLSVKVGSSATLIATITPPTAPQGVSWTTTPGTGSVTVSGGIVKGVKEGEATVIATSVSDPTKKAECTVTVTKSTGPAVEKVTISSAKANVEVGKTVTLTVKVDPGTANQEVKWYYDGDINLIDYSFSTDGETLTVKGVKAGTLDLIVASVEGLDAEGWPDEALGLYDVCTLTVGGSSDDPVKSVTISSKNPKVAIGKTAALKATVNPSGADQRVQWYYDGDVTLIDYSFSPDGLTLTVKGAKAGTLDLIAESVANDTKYDTCTVTVTKSGSGGSGGGGCTTAPAMFAFLLAIPAFFFLKRK